MSDLPEATIDQNAAGASFAYHARLNPSFWDNYEIKLDVRVTLLRAAKSFTEFLDVPGLVVRDIILTGSNAAFNYTEFSDLDVHLIVDYDETTCPEIAENLFATKKALWNQLHDIKVVGQEVEMYVEDTKNPVTALGIYSLLDGKWIRKPKPGDKPEWNDQAVAAKAESIADDIEMILDGTPEEIDRMMDRIKTMRRAGLARCGEFSTENLAFKVLRNLGYLDRLWQARIDAEDRFLSLEEE